MISCKIIDHHPSITSDHLPLSVSFKVATCSPDGARINGGHQTASARIKWEAPGVANRYLDAVKNNLSSLELPHALKPDQIDNHLKSINEALHDAASVSDHTLRKSLKPKAYCCPDLRRLRDRKRFWWSLWVANDRPRTGAVFSKVLKNCFGNSREGKSMRWLNLDLQKSITFLVNGKWLHFGMKLKWSNENI